MSDENACRKEQQQLVENIQCSTAIAGSHCFQMNQLQTETADKVKDVATFVNSTERQESAMLLGQKPNNLKRANRENDLAINPCLIEVGLQSKRQKTSDFENVTVIEAENTLSTIGNNNSQLDDTFSEDKRLNWTDIDLEFLCQDVNDPDSANKNKNDNGENDSMTMPVFVADYTAKPRQVAGSWTPFSSSEQNYLRGAKWSPDGACILTNSGDNQVRVFDLPRKFLFGKLDISSELVPAISVCDGELVYDFSWYPGMTLHNPLTCCFVTTSRDHPVHLWDSLTGQLRCSYRAFDHLDELTSAYSVAFSDDGLLLYCGFEKMIRVFDISRPGRDCQSRPTFMKLGQPGIISCICTNPSMNTVYAAGSYSRSVALYSEPKGDMMCMFQGQIGGVTCVKFSPDGSKLYSGGRKDPEILCWDIRNPGNILYTMRRQAVTNQRMYFDFDSTGRYIMSGNQDGTVSVWDSQKAPETQNNGEPILQPIASFAAHGETVNSLSCHPSLPSVVTGSGQRHFKVCGISDSEDSEAENVVCDNSIKVWWFGDSAASTI